MSRRVAAMSRRVAAMSQRVAACPVAGLAAMSRGHFVCRYWIIACRLTFLLAACRSCLPLDVLACRLTFLLAA
eukprot:7068878-Prymnesium_polylepis.1